MSQDTTPTDIDTHPCPSEWAWFASFDGGEHYEVGPCATRDQAIQEAIDGDQGFHTHETDGLDYHDFTIAEATHCHIDLSKWFDAPNLDLWFDNISMIMDEDGCGANEDGQRHPLDEVTPELKNELLDRIQEAIRKWQSDNQIPLKSYWFDRIRAAAFVRVRDHDKKIIKGISS